MLFLIALVLLLWVLVVLFSVPLVVVGVYIYVTVSVLLEVEDVWTVFFGVVLVKLTLLAVLALLKALVVWFSDALIVVNVEGSVLVSTPLVVSTKAWGVKKKTVPRATETSPTLSLLSA